MFNPAFEADTKKTRSFNQLKSVHLFYPNSFILTLINAHLGLK